MAEWPVETAPDDCVLPFQVEELGVRGRLARLGPAVTDIIHRHDYPVSVAGLLAQAVALTAMLGTSLKFDGRFTLQTKSDGPVDLLVVDFTAPGGVRGYAHFDSDAVSALEASGEPLEQTTLLGTGHLAMTIDRDGAQDRYQGIVPLEGGLTEAANTYFAQSEQIPTEVVLSAGQLLTSQAEGNAAWRAGGILVQHLPDDGSSSAIEFSSGDAPEDAGMPGFEEDDRWTRARVLVRTAEDHELLDPTLAAERLLFRLYHEDGVRAFQPIGIERHCSCSHERVAEMLNGFSPEDLQEMADDGQIEVTCEFCSPAYRFADTELEGTPEGTEPPAMEEL